MDCQIIVVPGKFDFKHFAMGYQKNSPYAEIFDYHIEKMRQSGVLDNIHTDRDRKTHTIDQSLRTLFPQVVWRGVCPKAETVY